MPNKRLSYRATSSALSQPLLGGQVSPEGIELEAQPGESMDKLSRSMLELRFDVSEMSIATFTKAREQGLPLIALPVFTSGRRFLQPGFMVSTRSDIRDLSELSGKRVGLPQYWMSSSVWQRMLLKQAHGVSPEQVRWVTFSPERMEALTTPPGVSLEQDTSGRSAAELMAAGELDASLSPAGLKDAKNGGQPVATPAYPDVRAAVRDYYQRTGIFPIMHMTVMKEDLARSDPWIVDSLLGAYARAKAMAGKSAAQPPDGGLDPAEIIGADPWPFGLAANRRPLEAFLASALEQGLISKRMTVDDLFVTNLPEKYR
jgi:4,5-dihydroxyphthalate decarboxylase